MRLVADRVGHRFPGQHPLFTDVSFELTPTSLYGIVGPSGSGKSTLLSILSGGLTPTAGSITADGVERIGWIMQNPVGPPRRTALDQIVLPLLARGYTRAEAEPEAEELLQRFGLGEVAGREFRRLSGGEAQRLCLARAVASNHDAILIDEPTAQLDRDTAHSISDVIREMVSKERIVVLATHDELLKKRCDELLNIAEEKP
ncbi:ATP-binding cassette domain-containing protein [Arachnia propionica]|uniref:ATP-binding cassette domain-containing protein n=1 Tax=Arachnia propionica TaxID=1750 RepID=UPI001C8ACEC1|nr:ATP-binding cassette domain-containing protein [Arachnia propionica]MDO5082728.1 ATP-binding cassette domain-containing protein [Arachnia propionica]